MRRVHHGDIIALISVLRYVDTDQRGKFLEGLFDAAHVADKYRKRFGQKSWTGGDGSLAAACSGMAHADVGPLGDPNFLECLRQVIEALQDWRTRQREYGGKKGSLP